MELFTPKVNKLLSKRLCIETTVNRDMWKFSFLALVAFCMILNF